jgi:hypothetical protein
LNANCFAEESFFGVNFYGALGDNTFPILVWNRFGQLSGKRVGIGKFRQSG